MFTETITGKHGNTETGTATEPHAITLLRRAVKRRGCTVEATRTGGVIIEWDIWDGGITPKRCTITLEPTAPVGNITKTVRADLAAIDARSGSYLVMEAEPEFRINVGRIRAGLHGVPPAATKRLIDRGLVGVGAPYSATSNGFLVETRVPVRVPSRPGWRCSPPTIGRGPRRRPGTCGRRTSA
ncbi:hypothetical protein ACFQ3Z_16300 [Streptomyces nogalater]